MALGGYFNRFRNWIGGIINAPMMLMGSLKKFEEWMDEEGGSFSNRMDRAMQITTVHACIKVISEGVACLPLYLKQENEDGASSIVRNHHIAKYFKLYRGIATPMELMETCVASMAGTGWGVHQIVKSNLGDLLELNYLETSRLQPTKDDEWKYRKDDGSFVTFKRSELWMPSNWLGLSTISLASRQLEEAEGQEKHAIAFTRNDATPGGIISVAGAMNKEQRDDLRVAWNKQYRGANKAFRIGVLWGDATYHPYQINHKDSQFIEQRRYSKEQVCAIFRVPPHMVADLQRAPRANLEHQNKSFAIYTLAAWLVRLEQSLNRDLLSEEELMGGYFFKFNLDALLRGDYKTRMEGNTLAIDRSVLLINEARAIEDRKPIPGGDRPLIPLNMAQLDEEGNIIVPEKGSESNEQKESEDSAALH